jgi:hypothetical protein
MLWGLPFTKEDGSRFELSSMVSSPPPASGDGTSYP